MKHRINRNIVECKENTPIEVPIWINSINRNIVECKDDPHKIARYQCGGVLIETLWNVKKTVKLGSKGTSVVLIETLWNVKQFDILTPIIVSPVLIETLWNVKIYNLYCSGA